MRAKNFSSYGEWMTMVPSVEGGKTYRFEVLYRTKDVHSALVSTAVILSWYKDAADTKAIQRDYVDRVLEAPGGWHRAFRVLRAPDGCKSVRVELLLRWTDKGSVEWKKPQFFETEPLKHRFMRVVTTRVNPRPPITVERNIETMGEILDRAGVERPDIVLFTETLVDHGIKSPVTETAQSIPGPATRMLSEKARKYKTYIVTGLHEREGNLIYNTAVLIDRQGEIAGKYRKTHLPLEEGERGITPGSEYPVLDTDFGRVGLMDCYDHWFSEPARILRLKGTEILLLPIAGDGVPQHWDVISRARAIDNGVYVISSIRGGGCPSRIIVPTCID
jgi:predicted amidohydrolase